MGERIIKKSPRRRFLFLQSMDEELTNLISAKMMLKLDKVVPFHKLVLLINQYDNIKRI
jgi:hypothetical protein